MQPDSMITLWTRSAILFEGDDLITVAQSLGINILRGQLPSQHEIDIKGESPDTERVQSTDEEQGVRRVEIAPSLEENHPVCTWGVVFTRQSGPILEIISPTSSQVEDIRLLGLGPFTVLGSPVPCVEEQSQLAPAIEDSVIQLIPRPETVQPQETTDTLLGSGEPLTMAASRGMPLSGSSSARRRVENATIIIGLQEPARSLTEDPDFNRRWTELLTSWSSPLPNMPLQSDSE